MTDTENLEEYIVTHFDEALEKGWIKVYYQPVVRTLSGKLCGMEALSRWQDPEKGLLSPAAVIPALEKARLIHRLDAYVLDQVGQQLHDLMSSRQSMVPISFNLSRLDFVNTDPLELVEQVVRKYGLLRDYLCIEITETTMVQNVAAMTRQLERLHKSGYKIWLDDFGSGYSSLNVLHNYHFDELKLDMAFLQNLNEKGRKIIVSVVLMAKALGVHTLAEGVETGQQLDFLKSIGCEKIQGFYYSRPLPFPDLVQWLQERNLPIETRLEENLYDKAGLVNVITNEPVAIVRYDGKEMSYLMANEAFLRAFHTVGTDSLEKANHNLRSLAYPNRDVARSFIRSACASGKEENFFYTENGQYMRFNARLIAGADGLFLLRCGLQNFTSRDQENTAHKLDQIFRKLTSSYAGIALLSQEKDRVITLESVNDRVKNWEENLSIGEFLQRYTRTYIHPLDRSRFLSFMNLPSLRKRALSSWGCETADLFRVRRSDGTYRWLEFHALVDFKNPSRDILLGIREDILESKTPGERQRIFPVLAASFGFTPHQVPLLPGRSDGTLFYYNMMRLSPLKLFWKDTQERYLGASQAFLDFYGVTLSQILHKTDGEIGWDLALEDVRSAEQSILEKGTVYRHIFEETIVKGIPHRIRVLWFPLYEAKKIIGTMGVIDDMEENAREQEQNCALGLRDGETGFLSYRGGLEAGIHFVDGYRLHKEDFTALLLTVPEYSRVYQSFGAAVAQDLLRQITRCFSVFPLHQVTLAHLGACRFLLFTKTTDDEKIIQYLQKLSNYIHNITQVDGCRCTLYLQYALCRGSESQQLEVLLSMLLERLREAEQQQYGQSIYIGDRIVFTREKFDTMDEQVVISDPLTDNLLYLNKSAKKNYRVKEGENYQQKKCYELLEDRSSPCPYCPNSFLRQDRFHTWTHHCAKNGQDLLMRDTLIPWRGRTLRFSMGLDLNQYVNMDIADNIQVYREAAINDIIAAGMREEDVNTGIQKMLARLGENLLADRCYLFEENPDGTVSATYAWIKDGLVPVKDRLQHLPKKDFQPLYNSFNQDQVALIPSVKEYREKHPDFVLPLPEADRLVAGHLLLASQSLGFTAVVNPRPDTFQTMGLLLATLTRFFATFLRNRNRQNSLEQISLTDALTGMGNRYAFQEYLRKIPDGTPLSFIFGDINNLKKENDTHGHEAGDRLIQKAAGILTRHKDGGQVFRMGGDEFLLILRNDSPEKAAAILQELQADYRQQHLGMALGMASAAAPIQNVESILTAADKKMYEDKKRGRD